jgi:hypothetical protein
MHDSNMSPEWIAKAWKQNPCVKLDNGDVRTGPVRLSFPHLLTPAKRRPGDDPDKADQYGAVLLFPLGADISVLTKEMREVALAKYPQAGKPGGPKLFNPIRDQDVDGKGQPGEAERYAGYVKGAMRIGANANRKIQVVDRSLAPVIDDEKIYPGVWAIVTLRCFTFERQGNKGPTFGLQNVMLVADDTNIGGTGTANPRDAFAGVQIEAGDIDADKAFGEGAKAEETAIDPFS